MKYLSSHERRLESFLAINIAGVMPRTLRRKLLNLQLSIEGLLGAICARTMGSAPMWAHKPFPRKQGLIAALKY